MKMNQYPIQINFKKLSQTAHTPTRGSAEAAGYDLYADLGAAGALLPIAPGETEKISTGIAIALPEFVFGGVYARSGLATKLGLAPANCVGVVDADYRGAVIVALHNHSREVRYIEHGERIAQLIVQPYFNIEFNEVDELTETSRSSGGFGSTGNL